MQEKIKVVISQQLEKLRQEAGVERYSMTEFAKWLATPPMSISRQSLYGWMKNGRVPLDKVEIIRDNFASPEQAEFFQQIIDLFE